VALISEAVHQFLPTGASFSTMINKVIKAYPVQGGAARSAAHRCADDYTTSNNQIDALGPKDKASSLRCGACWQLRLAPRC
jgi:hypothetical protein